MFQYSKLCAIVGLSAAVTVGVVFSYWFRIKKKRSQKRNNSTSKLLCEACKASLEAEMLHLNHRLANNVIDDTSDDEDIGQEMFQSQFDVNRSGLNDYAANRASLDLSDFESNRLSFTEHDTPCSDQESMKEFSDFNDHNQAQSESNSEEESKPSFQQNPTQSGADTVQFHKYGHPTKVIQKTASVLYYPDTPPSTNSSQSGKRLLSCSDSEDQDETPARRTKFDDLARPVELEPQNLEKAKAMMEKMGYKEGKGLGKHSQGRVVPVEMSKQRGRRGLGLTLPGLEPADLTWDQSAEVVNVEEVPTWLAGNHLPALPIATLLGWKETGPRNLNIENCTDFCDPLILTNIIGQKSIFDKLDGEEMRKARTRSNPFETIGKGIFLNRAAMKMANLDKVFDSMFTSPKTQEEEPMVGNDQLLYFADVCAGPGGFSEYVLWRKKWRAKGFGFTLKGECDFKLGDFLSGPCESFEPFYGVNDDGNVFDPANIESLMHFVMDHTDQQGVHFMMADGGFSVEGQENIQELLSKQLYLCQFLVALCIVRTGGHFVCKLFDLFSPFSVGLVYLMYRAFEKISIHKPNTSRPANSERYIICKWKREDCEPTREYLFDLNKELCQLKPKSKEDINLCVSMEELTQDRVFFDYIKESNDELGERQVVNLVKIVAFCRDMKLTETRQADLRRQCLVYWDVPDQARREDKTSCDELASKRLQKYGDNIKDIYKMEDKLLKTVEQMNAAFKSVYDWHCFPMCNEDDAHLFLGLGRNRVYRLARGGKFWAKADVPGLELSPGTMVYAEVVLEYKGEAKSQMKKQAFHIIDAVSLGDEEIKNLHYTDRLKMCKLYAESLYKSTRKELCPLRVKVVYDLPELSLLFGGLTYYTMKNGMQLLLLKTDECAFQTKGVVFFKATKAPWMRHLSKKTNYCYYAKPGSASFYDKERPSEACASVIDCLAKRLVWKWEAGVGVQKESPKPNVLHMNDILQFIDARFPRR